LKYEKQVNIECQHFLKKNSFVTPGELLAEGDYLAGENTYKEANKVYANRIGLADVDNKKVNVVALRAFYLPKSATSLSER